MCRISHLCNKSSEYNYVFVLKATINCIYRMCYHERCMHFTTHTQNTIQTYIHAHVHISHKHMHATTHTHFNGVNQPKSCELLNIGEQCTTYVSQQHSSKISSAGTMHHESFECPHASSQREGEENRPFGKVFF